MKKSFSPKVEIQCFGTQRRYVVNHILWKLGTYLFWISSESSKIKKNKQMWFSQNCIFLSYKCMPKHKQMGTCWLLNLTWMYNMKYHLNLFFVLYFLVTELKSVREPYCRVGCSDFFMVFAPLMKIMHLCHRPQCRQGSFFFLRIQGLPHLWDGWGLPCLLQLLTLSKIASMLCQNSWQLLFKMLCSLTVHIIR